MKTGGKTVATTAITTIIITTIIIAPTTAGIATATKNNKINSYFGTGLLFNCSILWQLIVSIAITTVCCCHCHSCCLILLFSTRRVCSEKWKKLNIFITDKRWKATCNNYNKAIAAITTTTAWCWTQISTAMSIGTNERAKRHTTRIHTYIHSTILA